MEEMKTIYQVEGKLCKDFISQISYTVCLDQTYEELDIEFSLDHVTLPPGRCDTGTETAPVTTVKKNMVWKKAHRRMGRCRVSRYENRDSYHGNLNDTFIGNIHRQLTTRHMHFTAAKLPKDVSHSPTIEGVLK